MNPIIDEYCENAFDESPLRGAARAEARRELASHIYEHAAQLAGGSPGEQHIRAAIAATDARAFTHGSDWKVVEPGHVEPGQVELAGRGRRLGAFLIDSIMIAVVAALITMAFTGTATAVSGYMDVDTPDVECRGFFVSGISFFHASRAPAGEKTPCEEAAEASGVLTLVTGGVALLYFGLVEGAAGQSVGKMAVGVRAVRADGSKLGHGAAFGRNALKGLYVFQLIDMFWWFGERRQRLLDRAARTIVVRDR